MATKTLLRGSDERAVTFHILERLFEDGKSVGIGVRLWDGSMWPDDAEKITTLVLNHPGALRAMLLHGDELSLAEAYIYGDFDVEGDFETFFEYAYNLGRTTSGWRFQIGSARQLRRLPSDNEHPWLRENESMQRRGPAKLSGKKHSVERDRQAIKYHYDVSNGFYALWLGARMVYSCAYFRSPEDSLDVAQWNKLDYVCRKLRLRPGQRFLDIGCGWGALAIHAAGHYGVKATGITLSEKQADAANAFIKANGLESRCNALKLDYRELEGLTKYDAIASIGMFEHVGEALLPTYFRRAYNLLEPGGVFLNHGIAAVATEEGDLQSPFIAAYVFPDGELMPINRTLQAAEETGFEVRDVESLREHYAMTLRHWVRRLEASHEDALRFVDEPTYRVWRLYMAAAAHNFARGRLNVYQSLLSKPDRQGNSGLPLTRVDWYDTQPAAALARRQTRNQGVDFDGQD